MITSRYQDSQKNNFYFILFSVFLVILALFPILTPSPSVDPLNPQGAAAPDYAKIPFLMLGTLFILGLSFISKFNQAVIWRNSNILMLFILFLGWATISVLWSINIFFNLFFLSKWYAAFFAMVFLNLYLNDEKQVKYVIIAILIASAGSQLLGLSQAFNITPNFIAKLAPQAIPPASTFGNRNMSMHFLILTLPLLLYFLLFSKKNEVKVLMFSLLVVYISYLMFSLNRTSWLGFIAQVMMGVLLFLIFIRPKRAKLAQLLNINLAKFIGFIVLLVFCVFIVINISPLKNKTSIASRFETVEKNTKTGRTENPREVLFTNTLYMIKDVFTPGKYPFIRGLGMGQWTIYYPTYMGSNRVQDSMHPLLSKSNILYKQTHNEYLQLFAELGIIGMGLFIAIMILMVIHVFRLLRHFFNSDDEENYRRAFLVAVLFLSFVGISFNLLLSFPLRVGVPLPLMLIYLVIIEFYYRRFIVSPEQNQPNKMSSNKTRKTKKIKNVTIKKALESNQQINEKVKSKLPCFVILRHTDFKIPSFVSVALGIFCFVAIYVMYQQYQTWESGHRTRNLGAARIQGLSRVKNPEARKKILTQIRRDLVRSIEIVPSDPDDASFILANLYRTEKRYNKSIQVIENALHNIHPYHIYMYRVLVSNYLQLKQYSKALNVLKKAIQNFSHIAIYYKDLGHLLHQFGKTKEGIPYLKQALELDPNVQGGNQIKNIIANYEKSKKK